MSTKLIKHKPELKGISINQDLTSIRAFLAYEARQLVREKKRKSTWVIDGKVYVYDLDEKRHVIRNEDEFQKMLNACNIQTKVKEVITGNHTGNDMDPELYS